MEPRPAPQAHFPRTALVTGATSGIGRAFAERLARDGFDLILTGRRAPRLRALASRLRKEHAVAVTPVTAELSERKDLDALVRRIRRLARLDVLVSNAGFGIGLPFAEAPVDGQAAMVDVHVAAAVRLVHAALQSMRRQGSGAIILVASMAAFLPLPNSAVYCGTKAFLHTFAEALGIECRGSGILVQSLCPGLVDTDFHTRNTRGLRPRSRGLVRWTTPDRVVDASMRALARGAGKKCASGAGKKCASGAGKKCASGAGLCIPGFWNRVGYVLVRLVPRGLYAGLAAARA